MVFREPELMVLSRALFWHFLTCVGLTSQPQQCVFNAIFFASSHFKNSLKIDQIASFYLHRGHQNTLDYGRDLCQVSEQKN